jgi:hypothetical protein
MDRTNSNSPLSRAKEIRMIKTKKTNPAAKVPAKKPKKTKKEMVEMSLSELMAAAPKITPKMEKELAALTPKTKETLALVTMTAIRAIQRVQELETGLDLLEAALREEEKTSRKKTSTSGTKAASRTRKNGAKTTS